MRLISRMTLWNGGRVVARKSRGKMSEASMIQAACTHFMILL